MPGSKTEEPEPEGLTIDRDTVELVLELGAKRHAYSRAVCDDALDALKRVYDAGAR